MTYEQYSKIDAVNFTTLKEMRRSPRHYAHRLENPRPDTTRLALGRAAHTAVFEPDTFLLRYACFKGERRAGAKWEAFKEQHAGETILKADEYFLCLRMRDAVRSTPAAMKYLAAGKGEQTLQWTDPTTGLACKGRTDWLSDSSPAVVDFKTTSDIDGVKFSALAARMAYHTQLAWYRDGFAYSGGGIHPAVIIACEVHAPHDVGVFVIDEEDMQRGTEEYQKLISKVAMCKASGKWPGKYDEEQKLRIPNWAFNDEETDTTGLDITVNGQEVRW
jgi:hypothetical protein